VAEAGLGFAGLLRQLRARAGLTQEELAKAAGLSPRSVSDLERGIHTTAHKDTALLLAGALGLAEPARPLFVAAARGRAPADEVLAALREETVAPGGCGGWPGRGVAGRPVSGAGAVRGAGRAVFLRA
jgi:transcriptional regulator with XRE-family HTH domain